MRGNVSQENGGVLLDDLPGSGALPDSSAIFWPTGGVCSGAGGAGDAGAQSGEIDGRAREAADVSGNEAGADASGEVAGAGSFEGAVSSGAASVEFLPGGECGIHAGRAGSVALHDYVVLHFAGDGAGDPLFLRVKEAVASAYAPYVKSVETGIHQGERVVHGQRMLQAQPDILLGWTSMGKADYLVRQLKDHKGSIENTDLRGAGLTEYATTCGEELARGHARSGDPAVLAGYLGPNDRFDKALGKFSMSYAEQTARDYEGFRKAIRAGKIKVVRAYL
jgi:hypothetical protein